MTTAPGFSGEVQAERRGAFWFVRLNRPEKRNALSQALLEALAGVCAEVETDPEARGVVLWGAGGHFCAGADFGHFQELMTTAAPAGRDPVADHNREFGHVLGDRVAS